MKSIKAVCVICGDSGFYDEETIKSCSLNSKIICTNCVDDSSQGMSEDEMIERGLYANDNGKIFDEYGNEYRDENGCVCYLED